MSLSRACRRQALISCPHLADRTSCLLVPLWKQWVDTPSLGPGASGFRVDRLMYPGPLAVALHAALLGAAPRGAQRSLGHQVLRASLFLAGRTPGPWLHAEAAGQSPDDIRGRNSQVRPPLGRMEPERALSLKPHTHVWHRFFHHQGKPSGEGGWDNWFQLQGNAYSSKLRGGKGRGLPPESSPHPEARLPTQNPFGFFA